jgi:hypothetical protein
VLNEAGSDGDTESSGDESEKAAATKSKKKRFVPPSATKSKSAASATKSKSKKATCNTKSNSKKATSNTKSALVKRSVARKRTHQRAIAEKEADRRTNQDWLRGTVAACGPGRSSRAWKHFRLRTTICADSGKTPVRAVCMLCPNATYKTGDGSSNLMKHMLSKHRGKWEPDPNDTVAMPAPISQGTLSHFVGKSDWFVHAVRWVVMTNQPLETLECPFFQSMISAANNKVSCGTSRHAVRARIQLLAVRGKRLLWEWQTNGDGSNFETSITTDAWTSKAGDGYIVLTAHLIDDHWSMHSYTAGIAKTGILGHTAMQYTEEMRSMLLNAGITNLASITVDTESTMQKFGDVLSGLAPTIYCCDHLLNLVAWAILKHPAIINVVEDIRTYVNAFRKSSQARATLKTLMKAAGQRPLMLQADVVPGNQMVEHLFYGASAARTA